MPEYNKVPNVSTSRLGTDRFMTMIEDLLFESEKKVLGYDEKLPAVKQEYLFGDTPCDPTDWKQEMRKNLSLGLRFTGTNVFRDMTWTDESIINFLDTIIDGKKFCGLDIGCKKPEYKNKVGIPVGLYRLRMLSCCLHRSDMMGFTHYNGGVINRWVQKNKSKFIGKCLGSLTKDEWETLSSNAYVYVNHFFKNDMDESFEMNKYCWENMTEEEKLQQIDRCDNLLWFWRCEF